MKEWRYIKPLNEGAVEEAEKQLGYKFPTEFADFAEKYNGGRPPVDVFATDKTKERTVKTFLSLNNGDAENIIAHNKITMRYRTDIAAFAIDNFGNYICFKKSNGRILFWDFETDDIETVAQNFDEFFLMVNNP